MTDQCGDHVLDCRYQGQSHALSLEADATVQSVKERLWPLIGVSPANQKLIGLSLPGGKLASGHVSLQSLSLRHGHRVLVMGSPDDVVNDVQSSDTVDIVDDFDFVPTDERRRIDQSKLDEIVSRVNLNIINPCRSGKKLLVLDIDYTIFDMKAPLHVARRPYVIDMLAMVYPYFDIAVWSQTSWSWLEAKLTEMGLLGSSDIFKISFVLDKTAMTKVTSKWGDDSMREHHCKPLAVIWAKLPQYGPHNTVIVDDLSRNFVLNPRNGVHVTAFKAKNADTDRELYELGLYLKRLGERDKNLDDYDHRKWRTYLSRRR